MPRHTPPQLWSTPVPYPRPGRFFLGEPPLAKTQGAPRAWLALLCACSDTVHLVPLSVWASLPASSSFRCPTFVPTPEPLFTPVSTQPLPPPEVAFGRLHGGLERLRFRRRRAAPRAVALSGLAATTPHGVAIDFSQVHSLLVVVTAASVVQCVRGHERRAADLSGGTFHRQHHASQATHGGPAQPVPLASRSLEAARHVVYLTLFALLLPLLPVLLLLLLRFLLLLLQLLLLLLFLLRLRLFLLLLLLLLLLGVRLLLLLLLLLLLVLLLLPAPCKLYAGPFGGSNGVPGS